MRTEMTYVMCHFHVEAYRPVHALSYSLLSLLADYCKQRLLLHLGPWDKENMKQSWS